MFFIAKLHPDLEETKAENYNGPWFNDFDKQRVAMELYEHPEWDVPISVEHRDIGRFGYVKEHDVVGQVMDLYVNNKQEMMVKFQVSNEHPEAYKELNYQLCHSGVRWGVSVGIGRALQHDGTYNKKLVHVAITTDPAFAEHGTWIYKWSTNEDIINAVIHREYAQEAAFMPPQLQAKLEDALQQQTQGQGQTQSDQNQSNRMQEEAPQPRQYPEHLRTEKAYRNEYGLVEPVTGSTDRPGDYDILFNELERRNAHLKKMNCHFLDCDPEFQDCYLDLHSKLKAFRQGNTSNVDQLKADGGMDPAAAERCKKIFESTNPAALPMQKDLMSFAGANKTMFETRLAAEKRKFDEEKAAMQKELELAKQQANQKKFKSNSYDEDRAYAQRTQDAFRPNTALENYTGGGGGGGAEQEQSDGFSFIRQRSNTYRQVIDHPKYRQFMTKEVTKFHVEPRYDVDPDVGAMFATYNGINSVPVPGKEGKFIRK